MKEQILEIRNLNWCIWYLDNDGQRRVLYSDLSYERAVKLWQMVNTIHKIERCFYGVQR